MKGSKEKLTNSYVILYKAKQGVSPENIRFTVKAKDKIDAKFKANKDSGLSFMYNVESVTKIE